MKFMKKFIFILLSIFCLLNIKFWPTNKYEWMLQDDPEMTLPIDSNFIFYSVAGGIPILFLLIFISGAKTKKEKFIIIIVTNVLMGIWVYKFHLSLF